MLVAWSGAGGDRFTPWVLHGDPPCCIIRRRSSNHWARPSNAGNPIMGRSGENRRDETSRGLCFSLLELRGGHAQRRHQHLLVSGGVPNHIVWDATEVVEFTRKHTGQVGEALGDIRRIVEQLVEQRDVRRDGFVEVIRKAMETKLGRDTEEALKALTKAGIRPEPGQTGARPRRDEGHLHGVLGRRRAHPACRGVRVRGRADRRRPEGREAPGAGRGLNRQTGLHADAARFLDPFSDTEEQPDEHEPSPYPRGARDGAAAPPAAEPPPQERNRPIHVERIGHVKAAIWANDGGHSGVYYTVTLSRVYKDATDNWQSTEAPGPGRPARRGQGARPGPHLDLRHAQLRHQQPPGN